MSGPALKHAHSHAAIHEAAYIEAKELTELFEKVQRSGNKDKALEVAYVVIEHWETRTLRHADSEEEGLYEEIKKEQPELKDDIVALKRDHDILRLLVGQIRALLAEGTVNEDVLQKFQALTHVNLLHNQKEEEILPHH